MPEEPTGVCELTMPQVILHASEVLPEQVPHDEDRMPQKQRSGHQRREFQEIGTVDFNGNLSLQNNARVYMKENELWLKPFASTTDGRNLPAKQTKKVIVGECDRCGNCSRAYAFSKDAHMVQDSNETKSMLVIERVG